MTGTRLVYARSSLWRAVGIHRFRDPSDFAMAVTPDILILAINFGVLVVIRRICTAVINKRFKRAAGP